MTDYHPVTKEELDQIIDLTGQIGDTGGWVKEVQPIANERMKLLNEVLSRPDPLALLEAWADANHDNLDHGMEDDTIFVCELTKIIGQLRTNPEAVRQQGIEEGWWKE